MCPVAASAAEVTGGSYVTVGTSQLGKVTIYFPKEYEENWAFINGLPVSTANSSFTGYILNTNGTGKYAVRIYNYNNGWEYRTYGGTGSYYTLTVNAYFPKQSSIFVKKYKSNTLQLLLYTSILLVGVTIISTFFKRS